MPKKAFDLTFEERLLTFEEELQKHLESIEIEPTILPQESNRDPVRLYNYSDTPMKIGGSTRVPDATRMKRRRFHI